MNFHFYLPEIFLLFTIIITLCCFIGIASRPLSFLAFFWPANSVFLGLLLRFPQTRQIGSFAGAFTGYMIADLVNGTPFSHPYFNDIQLPVCSNDISTRNIV